MIEQALSLLNLWSNPVFQRYRRAQLRLGKSIFWYLLTLVVTSFVTSLMFIVQTNSGRSDEAAARTLWIPLIVIQGFILMIKGTGKTSAGLIQDKIDQTLDYQRLTPVSPARNVLGYLFGLPILEYVMFALTLPHLVFVVSVGNIPIDTVLSVYLVFFTCTIFYHMTAIAMGMVMQRWIWGYLLSIVAVVFLNMILPTFVAQFGLKFLQYFSVWPVVAQKIWPLLAPPGAPVNPGGPFVLITGPVPFFEWTLSPFVFTLLLQAGLIATFGTMAIRRWKLANKHSLSKPYALGILIGFILLMAGNLWPAITGESLPFPIFGITDIDQVSEALAIGMPLVYSVTVWCLCLFLFGVVVPSHASYLRGMRRAAKLGRAAPRPWDDDSADIRFMSLFLLVALLGYWLLYRQMAAADFFSFLDGNGFSPWRVPLALGLVLLYSLLHFQVLEIRITMLAALLVWTVPLLVATLLSASMQQVTTLHAVIASISPIGLVVMSGLLPLESLAPVSSGDAVLSTGAATGLLFVTAQIAALVWRWVQVKKDYS